MISVFPWLIIPWINGMWVSCSLTSPTPQKELLPFHSQEVIWMKTYGQVGTVGRDQELEISCPASVYTAGHPGVAIIKAPPEMKLLFQFLASVHRTMFLRSSHALHAKPLLSLSYVSVYSFMTLRQLCCPIAAPRAQACVLKSTQEEQRQREKDRGDISDRSHQRGWDARKDKVVQSALRCWGAMKRRE